MSETEEPVEMVEVEKQELVDVLAGFVRNTHPLDAYDAYIRGLEILLNIDEDEALEALGWLYCLEDGDDLVKRMAAEFELDLAQIHDAMPCAGCAANVHRIAEQAYMVRDEIWVAAGDRSGMLCVACLEEGLGRRLRHDDFDWTIHMTYSHTYRRSQRLIQRMDFPVPVIA